MWILFVAGLCFWSSMASLLPTLPLYIRDVGGTDQQIGVVMGSFAIGMLCFRPWVGRLADQRSRTLVLLIGLAAAAIAPLGYMLVTAIPGLMLLRAFHGLSIAAFATAYSALVVDFSPTHQRGELIGYMSLVNPIGVALGPTLGSFLLTGAGYRPLFLMASGLATLGVLCTLKIHQNHDTQPSAPASAAPAQNFWRLLGAPRLRIPTLVMLLIGLCFGTMATFVPLLIAQASVQFNAGFFYTAAALSSFSVRMVTGRASDRLGRGGFISLSLLFYTSAMALLWQANQELAFLFAGILEGCGSGMLIPMVATLMADRTQTHERGQIFSLCMGGFDLGIALAGPILGSFAGLLGIRAIFALAATFPGLALLLFLTCSSKDLKHSLAFALGRGRDVYAVSPHREIQLQASP
nr:MFS transporter [Petrachloros mirabilis]